MINSRFSSKAMLTIGEHLFVLRFKKNFEREKRSFKFDNPEFTTRDASRLLFHRNKITWTIFISSKPLSIISKYAEDYR